MDNKVLEFFAKKHAAWSNMFTPCDDPSYGEGYDNAKRGAADDIDEFFFREFGAEWVVAKMKAEKEQE